ncbi:MAG: hypothetical protein JWO32_1948 [Bacteroidetes bacterium]|nr:hypothetical protein [Bacteroidota bacterium]
MIKNFYLISAFFLLSNLLQGQEWMLKLRSRVELRNWKLTTKAEKSEKSLGGASISLSRGSTILSQTTSNSEGDFEIDVPAKGDFILTITYAGCNTKKFFVSTNGVPEEVGKDNYKPTVSIGGFIMSKPLKGVDYLGLNEPLVKVEYKNSGQNFDKDEVVTNKGIEIVSKIYDAETAVIEKFCATNKLGDDALNKLKNCPLAKSYYLKALDMLPGEPYPAEQLAKAEQCILNKQAQDAALKTESIKKAEAANAVNEKKVSEKRIAEKKEFKKSSSEADLNITDTKSTKIISKTSDESRNENLSNGENGNSKRKTPRVIGVNKYKETIIKADDFFKTKRYAEAKLAYEDALKYRAEDVHATVRLSEIEKLLSSK